MNRYSAKLLFYYDQGQAASRHYCEERLISFTASDPSAAIEYAYDRGTVAEYEFTNGEERRVRFRFKGVSDIMELGSEAEEDEMWYTVGYRKTQGKRLTLTKRELVERLNHKLES